MAERTEGWQSPANAFKSHYFRDGRSLCGGWMVVLDEWEARQELGAAPLKADCKACWKKRAKEEGVVVRDFQRVRK